MKNKTPKSENGQERILFSVTKADVIQESDYPQLLLNIKDTAIFGPVTNQETIASFDAWFEKAGTVKHICCYGHWSGEPLKSTLNVDGLLPKSEWWIDAEEKPA